MLPEESTKNAMSTACWQSLAPVQEERIYKRLFKPQSVNSLFHRQYYLLFAIYLAIEGALRVNSLNLSIGKMSASLSTMCL